MEHRELISTYYKNDIYGSRAEVYRIKGKPFENTYSIAYFNSNNAMLRSKHFANSTLEYVENIAEDWALYEG